MGDGDRRAAARRAGKRPAPPPPKLALTAAAPALGLDGWGSQNWARSRKLDAALARLECIV